jgi:hypothetical protein
MCESFKYEILLGVHNVVTDTLKIALYTDAASIGPSTTIYTTANETSGPGYIAGGEVLTGASLSFGSGTAYLDFNDASWPAATFSARGALIYNASKANRAVAVLDFGAVKTATTSEFLVLMPPPTASTAVVRIA